MLPAMSSVTGFESFKEAWPDANVLQSVEPLSDIAMPDGLETSVFTAITSPPSRVVMCSEPAPEGARMIALSIVMPPAPALRLNCGA